MNRTHIVRRSTGRIFVIYSVCLLSAALLIGCEQSTTLQSGNFLVNLRQSLDTQKTVAPISLKKGKIGLSLIPRNYNDSVESWQEALEVARFLGVQVLQLPSGYWREDEPIKGAYQWQSMQRFIEALENSGLEFEISQDFGGPFFHANNMAPDYLQPISLTDSAFREAYLNYLTSYLDAFGAHISSLLIHAEGTYAYFDEYPNHFPAYLQLLESVVQEVHAKWPAIRVGVNIDPHNRPEVLSAIAARLDFVGFDVVQIDGILDRASDLGEVVDSILTNTMAKPVSIAGGWSSAGAGGGDNEQVAFYQALFRELREHDDRIEYIAFGPPFDEDKNILAPAYAAQFAHLPDDFVGQIVEWITQLGLIRTDGTAKPALPDLRNQIQRYYADRGTGRPD